MKKLFLIDGAAGTGKSDFIKHIKDNHHIRSNILQKYTTRKKREKEEAKKTDLIFISEEDFYKKISQNSIHYYKYGGVDESKKEFYGISKKHIHDSIKNYENTFVIVRNSELIKDLIEIYKNIALVIPIFIYTDRNLVSDRLEKESFSKDEVDFRLNRCNQVWNDYLIHNIYQKIIINNSNHNDFKSRINLLIDEFSDNKEPQHLLQISPLYKYELIRPLIGYKEKIMNKLSKYPYEKNIFLMMKYRGNNFKFYQYIESKVKLKGYNCIRADSEDWNITDDIYNFIAVLYCCKYGIALFDEAETNADYSPNVSYELGIMYYQKKECLILKHSSLNSIPFDFIKNLYKSYTEKYEFDKIFEEWINNISNK